MRGVLRSSFFVLRCWFRESSYGFSRLWLCLGAARVERVELACDALGNGLKPWTTLSAAGALGGRAAGSRCWMFLAGWLDARHPLSAGGRGWLDGALRSQSGVKPHALQSGCAARCWEWWGREGGRGLAMSGGSAGLCGSHRRASARAPNPIQNRKSKIQNPKSATPI
jgi:hypothetical protein